MASRDGDKFRKYPSGAEKARKRRCEPEFSEMPKGALEKYMKKDQNVIEREATAVLHTVCQSEVDVLPTEQTQSETSMLEIIQPSTSSTFEPHLRSVTHERAAPVTDYDDPGCWPQSIDSKLRDFLVKRGVTQIKDYSFPKDEYNYSFMKTYYVRMMPNGECINRRWLVYSKKNNSVFCFCCTLFHFDSSNPTQLIKDEWSDWSHLALHLKQHERAATHIDCLQQWIDLEMKLASNTAIDSVNQSATYTERQRWRNVLERLFAITYHLASQNNAFRGHNATLYTPNNGNFLSLVELLAHFDPVMRDHINKVKDETAHNHYLGHRIQNEIIDVMSQKIKKVIIQDVKRAKYFSVILDCTPDINHQEQLSVTLRIVKAAATDQDIEIKEYFADFIVVDDSTGEGLADVLIEEFELLGLNLQDCRGQGYDNGSSMKGHKQEVQARILTTSPRAFLSPCGSHSLNLVLGDTAKSSNRAKTFFGVLQRIYAIFSASSSKWKILKDIIPSLPVKPLSETRWECQIDSVKAIRFQASDIREALLEVADTTNDSVVQSEAQSLVNNELNSFEFLVSLVLWYDLLAEVNAVSKIMQDCKIQIDVVLKHIENLCTFLKKYRETGFDSAIISAKEIAAEMDVEPIFRQKRVIRRKRAFDYEACDQHLENAEQSFKTEYFIVIIDNALISIEERFELYRQHNTHFDFLYNIGRLKEKATEELLQCCKNVQCLLSDVGGQNSDIDGEDLFLELQRLSAFVQEDSTALEVLKYLHKRCLLDAYPNTYIILRILLTMPITVASAECSFSKLKLIKTYLRSTMSQERLAGLAHISVESSVAQSLDFTDLIDAFAAKKARKVPL